MAYRRRQVIGRSSTFGEDPFENNISSSSSSASSSLAAQALKASDAHRHSNGGPTYDYTSMGNTNAGSGLWGVLAKKAKEILDDDSNPSPPPHKSQHFKTSPDVYSNDPQADISRRIDNPKLRKGIDALTSSMNRIGDTIGNALEEGRTIVENKTADFIRRKGTNHLQEQNNLGYGGGTWQHQSTAQSQINQTSHEDQLKASRDVAMATAAKAKLLLRELKTVKADLAFTKQRCSQLEEENKILRDAREKGVNPADDDMIRLQLETLLAEKARLAHENSVYSRENRFLREIVEYHQLTMQDVVYLDEEDEEVTEVYPIPAVSRRLSSVSSSSLSRSSSVSKEMSSLTKEGIHKKEAASSSTCDVQVPKHDQESTRRC